MEYAMQLLIPILGGLLFGYWLNQQFGVSAVWTIILAILGMFLGLGVMYKRAMYPDPNAPPIIRPKPEGTGERPGPKLPWEEEHFNLHEVHPDDPEYKEFDESDDDRDDKNDSPYGWS